MGVFLIVIKTQAVDRFIDLVNFSNFTLIQIFQEEQVLTITTTSRKLTQRSSMFPKLQFLQEGLQVSLLLPLFRGLN